MPSPSASAGTTTASRGKAVRQGAASPATGTRQPTRVAGGAGGGCRRARLRAAGWRRLPTGLEDVSTYPALVAELLARNWTEAEVEAALAKNLLRVFKKVEEVSGAQGRSGHGDTRGTGTSGTRGCTGTQGGTGTRQAGMKEDTGTCEVPVATCGTWPVPRCGAHPVPTAGEADPAGHGPQRDAHRLQGAGGVVQDPLRVPRQRRHRAACPGSAGAGPARRPALLAPSTPRPLHHQSTIKLRALPQGPHGDPHATALLLAGGDEPPRLRRGHPGTAGRCHHTGSDTSAQHPAGAVRGCLRRMLALIISELIGYSIISLAISSRVGEQPVWGAEAASGTGKNRQEKQHLPVAFANWLRLRAPSGTRHQEGTVDKQKMGSGKGTRLVLAGTATTATIRSGEAAGAGSTPQGSDPGVPPGRPALPP